MATPFQVHAASQADYLAWLNAQSTTSGSDPNAVVPVFTFKGVDLACNYKWIKQKYLDQGGWVPVGSLVLEVLEPMTDIPVEGTDRVTFQSKEWRVQMVQLAAGKNPQLTCWDPNRGA